jgi:prevent-host-death family protein
MAEHAAQNLAGFVEIGSHARAMAQHMSLDNSHLDGYLMAMPDYSVAEAKNNLPKLLDRALAGEEVTITRRGKPIAKIVANQPVASCDDRPTSANDVDWIRRNRVAPKVEVDAAVAVREMRDDYRY